MKTYTITKHKIKKAIITENLKNERYFHTSGDNSYDDGTCEVCAVGAVLRNVKKKKFSGGDAARILDYTCGYSEVALAHQRNDFLPILSTEFEKASRNRQGIKPNSNEMKMFLLFITEAFSPAKVMFTVDHYPW